MSNLRTAEGSLAHTATGGAVARSSTVRLNHKSTDGPPNWPKLDTAATELPEVSVAKVSRGSTFQFEPRRSLPLTVV